MGALLGILNAQAKSIDASPIAALDLAQLLKLVDQGVISGKIAKTVFEEMATSGRQPRLIVEEKGLVQISDSTAIEEIVSKVIANCGAEVAAYKKGKTKLLGFFVGQVMQQTHGKANPKLVNEILRKKLAD
jgi:aspartyl-tRNA(Asn)/glutamyl-tRNA(Gln) amidotransferase subunit B